MLPETTTQAEISTSSPTATSTEEPATDENGEDIPRNIQAAQKILQTAKGRDFLNYSALVRDEAFNSSEFNYETVINVSENSGTSVRFTNTDFYPDEQTIKKHFLYQYENYQSNAKDEAVSDKEISEYMLSNLKVFRYYAVDDKGFVYSNIENKPTLEKIKKNDAYICYDGANITIGKLENNQKKYITNVLVKNAKLKNVNTARKKHKPFVKTEYLNFVNLVSKSPHHL
ncbi:MAG: hypothetical protein J6Q94_02285 [Clostridia bacterium]|nr:hypothetical protein [Clostridia bacterium]